MLTVSYRECTYMPRESRFVTDISDIGGLLTEKILFKGRENSIVMELVDKNVDSEYDVISWEFEGEYNDKPFWLTIFND